jgi:nucleoside-diphosphate-sugar epimerase
MSRFLVTGGSGFIGTNLVEELRRRGHAICNLDIAAPHVKAHEAHWQRCDILDAAALARAVAAFAPTDIVHLAARTDVDGKTLADYVVNTDGTANVLAAIQATPSIQRVVITSTQFVNQYHGMPKDDLDFAPHTVYGESKVVSEKLTRAARLACTWTFIRPTNIWGPWHLRYPHEFWRILGKGLYIHPGGKKVVRSYGYVGNVVHQILAICSAEPGRVNGRVFYVGDPPIDLLDWVNGFSLGQTGRKVRVVPAPLIRLLAWTGDALALVGLRFPITSSRYQSMTTSNDAPMEATLREFGAPPISLDEGIRQTVEWLRVHHPDLVKVQ